MNKAEIIVYIVSIPLLIAVLIPAIIGSIWFTFICVIMIPLGFTIGDFETIGDWWKTVKDINKGIWTYLFRIIEELNDPN